LLLLNVVLQNILLFFNKTQLLNLEASACVRNTWENICKWLYIII